MMICKPLSKLLMPVAFCTVLTLHPAVSPAMEFSENADEGALIIKDATRPVLSYRFGDQLADGVDSKYTRSCYVHPLWSVDGKTTLTADFPADHFHHRGIYWAWPRVWARGVQSENWHPNEIPLRQHFHRWISRSADDKSASFTVENKWLLRNEEEIARETVSINAHHTTNGVRLIEFVIQLEAVGGPLKIGGTPEGNKGYGGFCFRGAPEFKGAHILTSNGPVKKDSVDKPYKWVDLSNDTHGIAIFAGRDHPDYPPHWMVRNSYAGFINVSWPGMDSIDLDPGKLMTLRYAILVHDKKLSQSELQSAYSNYVVK